MHSSKLPTLSIQAHCFAQHCDYLSSARLQPSIVTMVDPLFAIFHCLFLPLFLIPLSLWNSQDVGKMILSLFEEVLPIICCNNVLCTVGRVVGFVPSAWALCISAWTSL